MLRTVHGATLKYPQRKRFQLILIKPSHYDDDGYVIQWKRSSVPSNTMAAIYGLGLDCAARQVLGDDVQIEVTAQDETNTRIRVERLARQIEDAGGHGLVAMVGVQTNQFPRSVDLARKFLARGIQVCIGGFHVSGCVAMLPELPADLQQAMDAGISLFAGEVEGRLEGVLQDAHARKLKPLYNVMSDLPDLENRPLPYLPVELIHRMSGSRTSFDAGRGCPFACSFCTIINVQGRKSRFRTTDDIEQIIRSNLAQGVHKFFVTDDNFSRNKVWEPLFDRMIEMREVEGLAFTITIQVDTLCHKVPRFIEKAARAGVDRVFIGLESINPDSLSDSGKNQNNITEYRSMLQAWHGVHALTLAGYILGFPTDTPESIQRDIRIIQRELPIDLLYFFVLTPLPGSQDHKDVWEQKVPLDPDMNNYDSLHAVAPHARMTNEEWMGAYHQAWKTYYTEEHAETVMRRARQWGFDTNKIKWMMLSFFGAASVEKIHPMDSGIFRRKYRGDRRPGRPRENPFVFYPRYWWEIAGKAVGFLSIYRRFERARKRVMKGAPAPIGNDVAMMPVDAQELDRLELFTNTTAARTAVTKAKRANEKRLEYAKARATSRGGRAE
jgi:radical SAM superfamily enzyme YgiQ (UPF0313 family)